MRLNKQTNHAIRMLVACARSGDKLVRVADLAEQARLTLQHALKIAHILMRQGLLINQRGRSGGVRLARPAATIKIGDVVQALERTVAVGDDAVMDPLVDTAFAAFIDVLDQHTLADFAARTPAVAPNATKKKKPRASTASRRTKTKAAAIADPGTRRVSIARTT